MLHIKMYNLGVRDLGGLYNLPKTLAHFFPAPEHFVSGIYELLLNAVEHGNLGIGFEEKTKLIRQGKWHEEVQQRLSMPQYANREVEIKLSHNQRECRLTIADQGCGFAWREYLGRQTDDHRPNGRGLWIVYNSQFDDLIFNSTGNEVTCVAHYS